jgi:hypothetical protein
LGNKRRNGAIKVLQALESLRYKVSVTA